MCKRTLSYIGLEIAGLNKVKGISLLQGFWNLFCAKMLQIAERWTLQSFQIQ